MISCSSTLFSKTYNSETQLTSFQLECSQICQNIFSEALSPFAILSLAGAGWVGQASKLSCLKFTSQFSQNQWFQQASSFLFSATAEGTFFHSCTFLKQTPTSLLEFGQGSIHSSVILAGCKLSGGIAPQSFILTQLFQCFAIVEINEGCGGILAEKEMGSFGEKMIRAAGTSIPVLISGQLLATCSMEHRIREVKYSLQSKKIIKIHSGEHSSSLFEASLITPEKIQLTPAFLETKTNNSEKKSNLSFAMGGEYSCHEECNISPSSYERFRSRIPMDPLDPAKEVKDFLEDHPLGDAIVVASTPLILSAQEYQFIRAGTRQRAKALSLFFEDLVLGNQRALQAKGFLSPQLLKDVIREATEFSSLEELRTLWKGKSPRSISFLYGPDLMRHTDGKWYVLEDNIGPIGGLEDTRAIHQAYRKALNTCSLTEGSHLDNIFNTNYEFPLGTENMVQHFLFSQGIREKDFNRVFYSVFNFGLRPRQVNPKARDNLLDLEFIREIEALKKLGLIPIPTNLEIPDFTLPDSDPFGFKLLLKKKDLPSFLKVKLKRKATAIINLSPEEPSTLDFYHSLFRDQQVSFLNAPGTEFLSHKSLLPFVDSIIRFYLREEPLFSSPESYLYVSTPISEPPWYKLQPAYDVPTKNPDELNLLDYVYKLPFVDRAEGVLVIKDVPPDRRDELFQFLVENLPLGTSSFPFLLQKFISASRLMGKRIDLRPISLVTGNRGVFTNPVPWGRASEKTLTNVAAGGSELVVLVEKYED